MIVRPTPTGPALALVVVAALASGCSDGADDPSGPDGTPTSSSAAAAPEEEAPFVTTKASIRKVSGGRLGQRERVRLRDKVVATVDDWFESAYLGGDYPRTDFGDAFGAFTKGAADRARGDRQLMSNAGVATTTYAVRTLARRVKIDVLAVGGRPSGVTVQFRLGQARAGESGAERLERVSGRLFLTYDGEGADGGWRIFGYDVGREAL